MKDNVCSRSSELYVSCALEVFFSKKGYSNWHLHQSRRASIPYPPLRWWCVLLKIEQVSLWMIEHTEYIDEENELVSVWLERELRSMKRSIPQNRIQILRDGWIENRGRGPVRFSFRAKQLNQPQSETNSSAGINALVRRAKRMFPT